MKIAISWIKVWWHCLTRMMCEDKHLMCSMTDYNTSKGWMEPVRKDFCYCGYLNNGKTWEDEIKEMKAKYHLQ